LDITDSNTNISFLSTTNIFNNLTQLEICSCENFIGFTPQIMQCFRNLFSLKILSCNKIVSLCLQNISNTDNLKIFTSLTELCIKYCCYLTDKYFENFKNLTHLTLIGCHDICDICLHNYERLTHLQIHLCNNIIDKEFDSFVSSNVFKNLIRLELTYCENIAKFLNPQSKVPEPLIELFQEQQGEYYSSFFKNLFHLEFHKCDGLLDQYFDKFGRKSQR